MKYLHWRLVEEVNSKEEAEFKTKLLRDIQDHLATKFAVYQRREPIISEERDFESNKTKIILFSRFSITTEDIAGYKGLIKNENNKH